MSVNFEGTPAQVTQGLQVFTAVGAGGLPGATAGSRYVGATTSGAPISGTFAVGDFVIDRTGQIWICTAAGTQGTWAEVSGGGGGGLSLTRTAVQTGNYTASANQIVPCDTTGGSFTVTLPNAPASNTLVVVKQVTQGGTNTVTVACAGSDVFNKTAGGTSADAEAVQQGMFAGVQRRAGIWTVMADDLPLSQLDLRYLALTGGTLTGSLAVGGALGTTPYDADGRGDDRGERGAVGLLPGHPRREPDTGNPVEPGGRAAGRLRGRSSPAPAARGPCPTAARTPSPRRCRSRSCPPPRTIMTSSRSSTTRP